MHRKVSVLVMVGCRMCVWVVVRGHACISTRVVRFVRIAGGNLMPCASTAQIYLVTDSILQKIRSCISRKMTSVHSIAMA